VLASKWEIFKLEAGALFSAGVPAKAPAGKLATISIKVRSKTIAILGVGSFGHVRKR
jgi:hypothetical protein